MRSTTARHSGEVYEAKQRKKFEAIDERRRALGVPIAALCGRAMVQPSTWVRIKAGAIPRPETLRKLASALRAIERDTIDLGEV